MHNERGPGYPETEKLISICDLFDCSMDELIKGKTSIDSNSEKEVYDSFMNLIMESSPLLGFGNMMTSMLTKQYLTITHKAQEQDRKTVRGAVNSMVTEDKLDIFIELLDHISDTTITNYIKETGKHKLPSNKDIVKMPY